MTYCARAQVFDDWKAFAAAAARGVGEGGAVKEPRLSNVTLAFLEACCREEVTVLGARVWSRAEAHLPCGGVFEHAHKLSDS